MVRRSFFPVQVMQQKSAQKNPYSTEPGKYDHKRNADLPEQLHWLITVIPHIKTKPFIYNHPRNKLTCSHKYHAADHLPPKRITPVYHRSLPREEAKADSSEHKHRPMGKSPKEHLKFIIDRAAECPQKQIFTYFFQSSLSRPHMSFFSIVDRILKNMTSQKEPIIHGFQYNKILCIHQV